MRSTTHTSLAVRAACACLAALIVSSACAGSDYAIIVSPGTAADPGWKQVVDALVLRHTATVITCTGSVTNALQPLRAMQPRSACLVATPAEATREAVAAMHRVTRQLNDDPYTDCFWGILTGYDAANALRIAKCTEPLVIHKVAAGTAVALELCEEGVWYDELNQGHMVRKERGGEPRELQGPADTTEALAKALTEYKADLFITSGHATEHDWQIGYRYRNGQFKCADGVLYGLDTAGKKYPIQSPNPKVYMPIGNCLMGHVSDKDAMALAFLNSGGVNQMLGYTVPTWYGYAGWGCLDYFVEQPGRYTFTEAFFANQAALVHRLQSAEGNDIKGLTHDSTVLAFYGDPAWEARMAEQPNRWDQKLVEREGEYTLEITPRFGEKSFDTINTNGSLRGGRPFVQFLQHRLANVKVTGGQDLKPVFTDLCILVPRPATCDPGRTYKVTFTAGVR